jgi:hypothetical protein
MWNETGKIEMRHIVDSPNGNEMMILQVMESKGFGVCDWHVQKYILNQSI